MIVLGISGWSGNGKTTLLVKLIPALIDRGYSVSTIKHAHHKFDVDRPGKDSFRHREAGAKEVLISSSARWALMHETRAIEEEAELADLKKHLSPVDILLIEGFKNESFPKIEVWRNVRDTPPLYLNDPSVIAVATDQKIIDANIPVLDIDDSETLADFIVDRFLKTPSLTAQSTANDCYAAPDQMLSVEAARAEIINQTALCVGSETISIEDAEGRILERNITSNLMLPPHDNSAVDGFAFRHADLENALRFDVIGRSAAGSPYTGPVANGQCVQIFTGAVMPRNCDTVVMVEDVTLTDATIELSARLKAGSNRRKSGEDVRTGDVVLKAGSKIRPQDIGRLASIGINNVGVFKKLKVGLLSTGDELAEPGQALAAGQIYDSNRYMLRSLLIKFGCEVTDYSIIPDQLDRIQNTLGDAARSSDLVISSGGVSMGDEDHVKAAIEAQGELNFWRIAIKPGRPLALGKIQKTPFIGLPGNPVAALVCTLQFVRPLIARLRGENEFEPALPVFAKAAFSMHKKKGRKEWLRGRYALNSQSQPVVEKFHSEGSGLITSLTWANGLIELDEDCDHISEGDLIKFIPFSGLFE